MIHTLPSDVSVGRGPRRPGPTLFGSASGTPINKSTGCRSGGPDRERTRAPSGEGRPESGPGASVGGGGGEGALTRAEGSGTEGSEPRRTSRTVAASEAATVTVEHGVYRCITDPGSGSVSSIGISPRSVGSSVPPPRGSPRGPRRGGGRPDPGGEGRIGYGTVRRTRDPGSRDRARSDRWTPCPEPPPRSLTRDFWRFQNFPRGTGFSGFFFRKARRFFFQGPLIEAGRFRTNSFSQDLK